MPKGSSVKGPLKERDFRRLLASQFLGQGADGLAQAVVATVLVLDPLAQGTPGRILSLFAEVLLPYSLISPFLGVFVDRWDRRKLLVGTNLGRAALLGALPFWALAVDDERALRIAVLGILGLGRLFSTTKSAVLPVVLHESDLLRGNNIATAGGIIFALLGGALGLWLPNLLDTEPSLALIGLVHVLASLPAARIATSLAHEHAPKERIGAALVRVGRELVGGLKEVYVRPRVRLPIAAIFLLRTSAMLVVIAGILILKTEFPGDSDLLGRNSSVGLALGAAGAGALAAAFVAPLLGRRMSKPNLILFGFVVSGLAIVSFGSFVTIPAIAVLMGFGGFGGFITKIAVDAQVQEALPDIYRGRAFSLYDILYNLASVAAAAIMVSAQAVSLTVTLVSTGLAILLLTALLAWAMRRSGMLDAAVGAPPAPEEAGPARRRGQGPNPL